MDNSTPSIPPGYCQCGCGTHIGSWEATDRRKGRVKGEPKRFFKGHHARKQTLDPGPNLNGFCMCGCGERTLLASKHDATTGRVKGKPMRFISGHNSRVASPTRREGPDYIKEDRGFETSCWIWQGKPGANGYATVRLNPDIRIYAHRFYYERFVGEIPPKHHLHHRCEVPLCVNPEHLVPLTPKDHRRAHGT